MRSDEFRAWWQSQDLTQRTLAQNLGVTGNTVARWERGELTIPHWVDLLVEAEAQLAARKDEVRNLHEKIRELSEAKRHSGSMPRAARRKSTPKEAPEAGRRETAGHSLRRTGFAALHWVGARRQMRRQRRSSNGSRTNITQTKIR
jgi:transcriptional regulator with XRE-family HTH domain